MAKVKRFGDNYVYKYFKILRFKNPLSYHRVCCLEDFLFMSLFTVTSWRIKPDNIGDIAVSILMTVMNILLLLPLVFTIGRNLDKRIEIQSFKSLLTKIVVYSIIQKWVCMFMVTFFVFSQVIFILLARIMGEKPQSSYLFGICFFIYFGLAWLSYSRKDLYFKLRNTVRYWGLSDEEIGVNNDSIFGDISEDGSQSSI